MSEKPDCSQSATEPEDEWDDVQRCRVCGCTDEQACPGGCYWVEDDLCSRCAEKLAEELRNEFRAEHPGMEPILPGENEPPSIMQYLYWLEARVRSLTDDLTAANDHAYEMEERASRRHRELQNARYGAEERERDLQLEIYNKERKHEKETQRLKRATDDAEYEAQRLRRDSPW